MHGQAPQGGPRKQRFGQMSNRKRKIAVLATVFSLALFAVSYGFVFPTGALAWDNCPKGLVNDPYPGACRQYVDTNSDGICDLSQSKPVSATTTTALAVTTTTSGEPPTGDCPLGPCAGCGACISGGVTATVTADVSSDSAATATAAARAQRYSRAASPPRPHPPRPRPRAAPRRHGKHRRRGRRKRLRLSRGGVGHHRRHLPDPLLGQPHRHRLLPHLRRELLPLQDEAHQDGHPPEDLEQPPWRPPS